MGPCRKIASPWFSVSERSEESCKQGEDKQDGGCVGAPGGSMVVSPGEAAAPVPLTGKGGETFKTRDVGIPRPGHAFPSEHSYVDTCHIM